MKLRSLIVAATAVCTVGLADTANGRTSLAGIDAKLDQLLAGQAAVFDPARYVLLDHVNDATSPCSRGDTFRRRPLGGVLETEEFVVPAGFTLLITSVSWEAQPPPTSFVAGRVMRLSLVSRSPAGAQGMVYRSPPVEITTANSEGALGGAEVLNTGVAIAEAHRVCTSVFSTLLFSGGGASTAFHSLREAVLHGLLIPNPAP